MNVCGYATRSLMTAGVLAVLIWTAGAEQVPKPIAPGKTAPSFSLPTLAGTRQTLSVWCGKLSKPYVNSEPHVVVLSFWATYCKPCQKEIPELMKFAKSHEGQPIKIFCISLDKEGASIVAPFVKEKGYTLPIMLDPYKRTAERYGVKSLPALVVIGPDGIVRYSSVGYKDDVSLVSLLDRVVESAKQNKNYTAAAREASAGESIEVQHDEEAAAVTAVGPKEKWQAVARVECGEPIEDVAGELGVKSEEIKEWYEDIKKAALTIWKGQN